MEEDIRAIARYCAEHIRHYAERVDIALDIMGECRCPLVQADYSLSDEIADCIREWCDENGIPYGDAHEEIEPEEVIYAC